MRESLRIDSPFMGAGMPKAYSRDLRERVITAVETGASRREAAERFEVSVASAVKWLQRWYQQRSAAPKLRGGSVSPLEEFAVEILDLIAQWPDLTLVETVAELRKRRIKTSRSSLWRFLDRHNITLKKSAASSRTAASRCGASAPPLDTRARYADPARLVFIDETAVSTNMVRLRGRAPRGVRGLAPFRLEDGRRSPSWPLCVTIKWSPRWWSKVP